MLIKIHVEYKETSIFLMYSILLARKHSRSFAMNSTTGFQLDSRKSCLMIRAYEKRGFRFALMPPAATKTRVARAIPEDQFSLGSFKTPEAHLRKSSATQANFRIPAWLEATRQKVPSIERQRFTRNAQTNSFAGGVTFGQAQGGTA